MKQTIGQLARRVESKYWKKAVFKKWGDKCLICGRPAQVAHHFKPKGSYKMLRFNLDNGIPLCNGCHFRLHKVDPSLSNLIAEKRGKKWFNKIQKLANKTQSGAYSKDWVKQQEKLLKKYVSS